MLSNAQFGDLAKRLDEPDSGFSIRTDTGKEPSTGYMVSQSGTEEIHPSAKATTGADVRSYAITHQRTLKRQGRYMGGWHDPQTHEADLDISRRFANHDRATLEMWAEDQDSLYNLNHGHSERNYEKLGTDPGTPFGKIVHDVPDKDWYEEVKKAAKEKRGNR